MEVHVAVTLKISAFWDMTPCSLVDINKFSEELPSYTFSAEEF
jgi:hypothetical protein